MEMPQDEPQYMGEPQEGDTIKPTDEQMYGQPMPNGEEEEGPPPGVRLIIKPLLGDKFMLEMPWECRVRDLKEAIQHHWPRFNPHMHRVVCRGEELFEHRKLHTLDLMDGDVIDIPQW